MKNLWSGWRPLVSAALPMQGPRWDSCWISLCHGEPTALDLQVWSFRTLQQFIGEVDVGLGWLIALVAGLICLPAFPSLSPPRRTPQHCPSKVTNVDLLQWTLTHKDVWTKGYIHCVTHWVTPQLPSWDFGRLFCCLVCFFLFFFPLFFFFWIYF